MSLLLILLHNVYVYYYHRFQLRVRGLDIITSKKKKLTIWSIDVYKTKNTKKLRWNFVWTCNLAVDSLNYSSQKRLMYRFL